MMNEAWDRFCHDVGDALYDGPEEWDEECDGVDEKEETCDDEEDEVTKWNA